MRAGVGRALTVLGVAYPLASVGPDSVGGAEQVLSALDHALVAAGHRSIVVACEGSCAAGTLVATPRVEGPIDREAFAAAHRHHREAIAAALARWDVDVVHVHGVDFHRYLPPPGPRLLATLHLPPEWYDRRIFHLERPDSWLHCVSAAQQRRCPGSPLLLPPIENGVPLDALRRPLRRRGFTVALGRICPEKGFHHALDAARLADVPLLLAGQVYPYESHERYFRDSVVPRLDDRRRFLGPVGFRGKRRLLNAARCLLVPSEAPETSSLVAMEAMACGTPVVAFPAGALAELVEPGVTGFLVRDARGMADAIHACDALDRARIREAARERFSVSRMVERYLAAYERLMGARRAA